MNSETIKEVGTIVKQAIVTPIYGVLLFLFLVLLVLIILDENKRESVTRNFVLIIRAIFRQSPAKPPDSD